jgi:hypothetical protein
MLVSFAIDFGLDLFPSLVVRGSGGFAEHVGYDDEDEC